MGDPQPSTSQIMPSTSDFIFQGHASLTNSSISTSKQQRRVSLPASPRHSAPWSFRDDTGLSKPFADVKEHSSDNGECKSNDFLTDVHSASKAERRRKKWSADETAYLVEGCRKHGVGNWKLMVEDTELKFDNRSPVDLKDRFRTYFNDSYRQLYPNAKTHLSHNTIRGVNPDGTSLFDKMRSRKRKPFTPEEDAALKAGYEKHGTSWATIVKDPVFQVQNRRSTDLRDRFRNAFPDLYISAGYKPRPPNKASSLPKPAKRRKGSDGDLPPPSKWRRSRSATMNGLPDTRNALSDGELSSGEEDHPPPAQTPTCDASSPPVTPIELEPRLSEHKSPTRSWSQSHVGSPAPSQTAEYFPPTLRTLNMIPKSAWGPQDWLSSNSRMDSSNHLPSLSQSISSGPPSSFSQSRSHSYSFSQAIFDRYDLSSAGHLSPSYDFAHSEAGGYGGDDSAFSDADMFASSGFRGFTHHSNTAGDLIFGTRSQGGYSGYGSTSFLGHDGTINPMQLHAIDERVESIRLDDRAGGTGDHHNSPHATMSPSPLKAGDILPDVHPPMLPPPSLSAQGTPDVLLEKLAVIPGGLDEHEVTLTPTFATHHGHLSATSTAPSAFQRFSGSLQRSLSQPPASLPTFEVLHHRTAPATESHLSNSASYSSFTDPFSTLPSSHLSVLSDDIPFLDMHYWGPSSAMEHSGQQTLADHSTGALDLARSPAIRPRSKSPPFKRMPPPLFSNSTAQANNLSRPTTSPKLRKTTNQHQRVQSAVTSSDLQTTRNDNKRKRVSWDGGT